MRTQSAFWDDLAADPEDADFKREYLLERLRVQTIDEIVNAIDESRIGLGLSKADVARRIGVEPAAVRRLFSAQGNPTIATLAAVAGTMGLRITVEAMPPEEVSALQRAVRRAAI